jgi:protein O-mannosyl-transferase
MAKKKISAKRKWTNVPLKESRIKDSVERNETNKTLKVAICIFLIVATFCVYSQIKDHQFINYDDGILITKNSRVQAGFTNENILRVFTTAHFGGWQPVTSFSYILDYQLYGLNPKGFLLTNLFIHIANSLLLFLILFRMTGAIWKSAFVAVLFSLHPLNVESVAWAAERKNVLSAFFMFLTIWAYIGYTEKPTAKKLSLVTLLFSFGIMSKPMVVTLPFALLLFDFWPLERFQLVQRQQELNVEQKDEKLDGKEKFLKLVLEKLPLFILSFLCSIWTLMIFEKPEETVSQDPVSIVTTLSNVMFAYSEYLWKMVWPIELAILYPHPGNVLALWKIFLCGIALLFITTISIKLIRKAPYFAMGWFWYLGTLIPVIGFINLGLHLIADRYVYLPLIGIFIIVAWGIPELLKEWHYGNFFLKTSAGILILALILTTWTQVSYWKSSITVFKHAIKVTDKEYPSFAVAHDNLGLALSADREYEEAISHFKRAINLKYNLSNWYTANLYNNLGLAMFELSRNKEAIDYFRIAIQLADYPKAHSNLGNALFADQKIDDAINHYQTAIRIKPDYAEAHFNLGNILFSVNKKEEAIGYYNEAIKIWPDFAMAHNNLGNALAQKGDFKEAIAHYRKTLEIKPDLKRKKLELKPDLKVAQKNLETALRLSGELRNK